MFLAGINFYQFEEQYQLQRNEITNHVQRLLAVNKVQLANFLEERRSALTYVNLANSFEQLADLRHIATVFRRLRMSFGGFVDLGLIDSQGIQRAYIGPYNLEGREYKDQDWYKEVQIRGIYISDVFLGHRNFPHFVIAVRHEGPDDQTYVLRATIDTGKLNSLLSATDLHPIGDIFLVNSEGVLQTPSTWFGGVLTRLKALPQPLAQSGVVSETNPNGGPPFLVATAKVEGSPFIWWWPSSRRPRCKSGTCLGSTSS